MSNECSNRNGGCSNLCLPVPAIPGFKCSCPEGVSLKHGDDMTCEGGKGWLFGKLEKKEALLMNVIPTFKKRIRIIMKKVTLVLKGV